MWGTSITFSGPALTLYLQSIQQFLTDECCQDKACDSNLTQLWFVLLDPGSPVPQECAANLLLFPGRNTFPSIDNIPPTLRKHPFSQSCVGQSASLRVWKKFCIFLSKRESVAELTVASKPICLRVSIAWDRKWRHNTTGTQNNQEKF